MRGRYEEIRELGGEVLVVTFSRPERAAAHSAAHELPFPIASDPDARAYRAFGMQRCTRWTFARPGIVLSYLGLILRGRRPHAPAPEDDLLRLGGDFVLDGERRLIYAHPSRHPASRAHANTLVAAVRGAAIE